MPLKSATHSDIDGFLSQKRLAVVGVSRNENEYSRLLFRELAKRGYDVAPVNPAVKEMDGVRCFAHIADVTPRVDGALVILPSATAEEAVRECVEAGIPRIWSKRDVLGARELCQQKNVSLVAGYCPFIPVERGLRPPVPRARHAARRDVSQIASPPRSLGGRHDQIPTVIPSGARHRPMSRVCRVRSMGRSEGSLACRRPMGGFLTS